MKRETIKNIFNFLKEKEGKKLPKGWHKLLTKEEIIQELETEKLRVIPELENHPDDIQYRYEGSLDLSNTNITKLPNDLYVEGYLSLTNCKQLIKLPDDLYVGGFLSLTNCNQLTELPDNLYVSGRFNLDSCKQISELPDNLYVGESLILIDSNITELPDNLYVRRNLWLANTPLDKYTDEEIREMITSKGGTLIGTIDRL